MKCMWEAGGGASGPAHDARETQVRAGACWDGRGVQVRMGNESAQATYRPTVGYPIGCLGASSSKSEIENVYI